MASLLFNPGDDPGPSFLELLRRADALPAVPEASGDRLTYTHGTTVVAIRYADGVVMGGDRRATSGFTIASRRIEKVFPADEHSVVGIAGVAAQAVELVRLFQTELEHYEKVEGDTLSLEGKANRLGQMIRGSLPLVMQGLVVVPIYGGFDTRRGEGRLFRYDAIGGRYDEADYNATGSGSRDAKASLKKRWRPGMARQEAVEAAVESLLDASEADTATGGPDPVRGIFPSVHLVTAQGVDEVPPEEVRTAFEAVLGHREGAS